MTLKNFIKRTGVILSVLLSLQLSVLLGCGWCMTQSETDQYIKIQTDQWNDLKTNFQILNQELTACKDQLQKIKKPSSELVTQLTQAEKMLKQLQEELQRQNDDLTMLSRQAEESKTLLQTLKTQIDKERRVHRRQVWQNRFWCLLIGVGIGYAASR